MEFGCFCVTFCLCEGVKRTNRNDPDESNYLRILNRELYTNQC